LTETLHESRDKMMMTAVTTMDNVWTKIFLKC